MKTQAIIDGTVKLIHSFIYTVGCIAIWDYSIERWHRGTFTAVGIAFGAMALWYLWVFVIHPFRVGLRGESR
jgi:hypothetical protein